MFNKDVILDIPCLECNYKTKLSIKELEQNPTFICLGCNKSVTINADKFTQGLKEAEEKILKAFKNIS